jgi:hypothetical protein
LLDSGSGILSLVDVLWTGGPSKQDVQAVVAPVLQRTRIGAQRIIAYHRDVDPREVLTGAQWQRFRKKLTKAAAAKFAWSKPIPPSGSPFTQWVNDVIVIAEVLAADNPGFDRRRFYRDCGWRDVGDRADRKGDRGRGSQACGRDSRASATGQLEGLKEVRIYVCSPLPKLMSCINPALLSGPSRRRDRRRRARASHLP